MPSLGVGHRPVTYYAVGQRERLSTSVSQCIRTLGEKIQRFVSLGHQMEPPGLCRLR